MTKHSPLPELLLPSGSPEALDAAIAGGADAVYFGGGAFNARMNARNFAGDALGDAIRKCQSCGVKTNITFNTLIHEREIPDALRFAEQLANLGADALIVADLGLASLIHRYFPELPLHASTQAAGHNAAAAVELQKLGFSRMVAARELSMEDFAILCRESPIETEMFIHGAICVSQSGQCLASAMIGGRSGNRGECAQPCRLPYRSGSGAETYALSIKDMCLAGHITELIGLGVSSLKIEGRMKGPDYVYGVAKIYRRLLDEGRNADADEMAELRALFSRSGFTDGYFTRRIDRSMLGVRTDADKNDTRRAAASIDFARLCRERSDANRPAVAISACIQADKPSTLTLTLGEQSVTTAGMMPQPAKTCPLTVEAAVKSLTKFGGTPWQAGSVTIALDDGLMLPVSALNALRRDAVAALAEACAPPEKNAPKLPDKIDEPSPDLPVPLRTARFQSAAQIPEGLDVFDILYVPLERFSPEDVQKGVSGVILPPVILDSDRSKAAAMLETAADAGIRHALVSNLGHLSLAKDAGMIPHGDFRLNIYNRHTAASLLKLGFADLLVSPELTVPSCARWGFPPYSTDGSR
ncbi:MAG: U32 family peptidase [Clostridia bacterium]|nr:U32 family peptidase [Clostridia bacterium]